MTRRDGRSLDHKTLEELRIRAVERVQAGESPEDVIRMVGFTRSCIYTWLALYLSGVWGALRARALKGRPMRVQPQQMRWLYRTITGKSPLQYRFEFAPSALARNCPGLLAKTYPLLLPKVGS